MITHIQGKLVEKTPTYVVIDCNGVGYILHISLHTFSKISDNEKQRFYTHLIVKEDSQTLFGFKDILEREIFRLLISVSGIGASIARTMLSSMNPSQVQQAIASSDVATIQTVKGIGAKTAQRLIIDLKDKILKTYGIDEISSISNNTNKTEALSALEVLGFNKKQSEKVIDTILKQSPDLSVEAIIKQALKKI